jgi:hypothetical protein
MFAFAQGVISGRCAAETESGELSALTWRELILASTDRNCVYNANNSETGTGILSMVNPGRCACKIVSGELNASARHLACCAGDLG